MSSFEKRAKSQEQRAKIEILSLYSFFFYLIINLIILIVLNYYQLAFFTPGIRPLLAISLKVTLERPNVLM
ncbi:hypothetical protein NBC122_01213 [Chryseobacterium salivictor]|uniref:Uncharacterized protein n=1 Tax=Chryseobacterium salivictor TaxID=2547600 RepID=A0A4P6ZEL2_9FLAO|nr:hypothetical protein NBC122_01213 [Chryseobacterium salivictor]